MISKTGLHEDVSRHWNTSERKLGCGLVNTVQCTIFG